MIINNFYVKSKNWWSSFKTAYKGKKLQSLTSQCGLKQAISDPTDILESSSSCRDLIFIVETKFSYELRRSFFTSP